MKKKLNMKIILFLSTTFLLIVGNIVNGQSQSNTNWKFGLKGGINQSNIRAVDNIGEKSGYIGTELYGGFVSEYNFDDLNAIQSSALVSYTEAVTFIEIPLYYKYKFNEQLSIFTGPKLGYIPDPQGNAFHYFPNRLGISGDFGLDYRIFKNFYIEGIFSKGFTEQIDDTALEYYRGKRDVIRIGIVYFLK